MPRPVLAPQTSYPDYGLRYHVKHTPQGEVFLNPFILMPAVSFSMYKACTVHSGFSDTMGCHATGFGVIFMPI